MHSARAIRALGADEFSGHQTFAKMTWTKLRSDMEQLGYLIAGGKLPSRLTPVVEQCRQLVEETPKVKDGEFQFDVPALQPFAAHYNRLMYDHPEPAVPGSAVNRELDFDALQSEYYRNAPGLVYFDDFLSPAALASLQRFCREPTIWFQHHFLDEVGAGLGDGFCCPLLLQIASEIRTRFARIIKRHLFGTCWAYKYFQNDKDGHLHADQGAVNINFWITPDAANLDPELGGLWVWDRKVPVNYFGMNPERKQATQTRIVGEPGTHEFYIPYRCNRAMIFHSDLLHKSHRMNFKDNYEDRRVSVTFLYGKPTP